MQCIWGPHFAIDGELQTSYGKIFISNTENYPWFEVELSHLTKISSVTIYNRPDCCGERFKNVQVRAGRVNGVTSKNQMIGLFQGPGKTGHELVIQFKATVNAEYMSFQIIGRKAFMQINGIKINKVNATSEYFFYLFLSL